MNFPFFVAAEPPSYDSLFGRIRDTHKASRNFIDFLAKLLLLLLGTIGCTIACSVTVVIPICMIVIGSIHFNDCPAEPYIPLFLIVGGKYLTDFIRSFFNPYQLQSLTTSTLAQAPNLSGISRY